MVGLRSGTIYKTSISTGAKQAIMMSHSDGEVWGMSVPNNDTILTCADDNQILAWSTSQRRLAGRGTVSSTARALKRRGASSLTQFPDSQCARAVTYNPTNGHVAVGHNDGTLTVRAGIDQLDNIIATNTNAKEWIEAI
jgi:WD40 repeat protein